jgi:hypothetical protein
MHVGKAHISHLINLSTLSYKSIYWGRWVQAVEYGEELAKCARETVDDRALMYELSGLEILARAQHQFGLIMSGVAYLRNSNPLIASRWGEDDPWRIQLILLQENWLRECGEEVAADTLKAEVAKVTSKAVEEIENDDG